MQKSTQETAPPGPPPGTVIDGRYRVIRYIGQGGAGLVHEVEHLLTGRRLAMKTLHEEAGYGRLEQEAKATSAMKNSHAVKITDMGSGKNGAGAYLVMDLLDGQSLRQRLDYQKRLPIDLTINMALQVCECLAEAHTLGIIHRDLKPDNIFLTPSPLPGQHDVKVLDFGVVKISGEGALPQAALTRTGSTVGTPYYMSLEQLRNSSAVDARADIYSLGVVLYECLTGRTPFEQAETFGDLIYALCSGPPTHVVEIRPDTPQALGEVIMRALSVQREDRQTSMVEIARALLPLGNPAFGLWLHADKPEPTRSGQAPAAERRVPPPLPAAAGTQALPLLVMPPREPREPGDWDTTTTHMKADPRAKMPVRGGDSIELMLTDHGGTRDPDTPTRALTGFAHRGGDETQTLVYHDGTVSPPAAPAPRPLAQMPMGPEGETMRLAPLEPDGLSYLAPSPPKPQVPAPPLIPHLSPVAPFSTASPSASSSDELQTARLHQPLMPSLPDMDDLSFKPAWKRALDRGVARLAQWAAPVLRPAMARFHEASPGEQLALAVGGASLFAALFILFLYLIFS
ncbi:serine/threonine-protein kinase [Chondromyces apiculatus]|uniref:Protein kinase domain-containing protein n=1 Tax=Chondromyces apiculatus DSM 436 TaxID=1192034 RepID=A0A017T4Z5_9BACT|nr:serine/threonine-protein kinase [Chondromyces apiculatus]EYF04348.1 Hypothetical protein CAP_4612 [Chondromyces apiculatus DSM 436]